MHLKTPTVLLEIFQKTTSLKRKLKREKDSQITKWQCLALLISTKGTGELEESALRLYKRSKVSRLLHLRVVPSKREMCLYQSLEGIMTEVIYPSELIIRVQAPNSHGKYHLTHSTIIIIYQFSLTDADKKLIPIVRLQLWELIICLIWEEARSYQSYPSSLFQSKVNNE